MKHNIIAAHKVIGTIVGIIIFIVLFKYLAVQIGDTSDNVTLAHAWLSLVTAIFGPVVGAVTAFIGHATSDALTNNGTAWWTWVIADGLFGLFIGLITKRLGILIGKLTTRKLVLFNIWQLVANIVIWLVVAPLGDYWVYNLSLGVAFKEGLILVVVNFLTIAIVGTGLLKIYQHFFVE